MKLVLFDIDGTILTSNGQAGRKLVETMIEIFGTAGDLKSYSFAGKTDPLIVQDLMTGAGHSADHVEAKLPEVQKRYFDAVCDALDPKGMTVFPGVIELIKELSEHEDTTMGLVTGNWEKSARAKLDCIGMNSYFPFGGFGDDGPSRRLLPPAAVVRAQQHTGRSFAPEDTIIVGDTPNDIDCAHANGMKALAVATGTISKDVLVEAGADAVVSDFEGFGVQEFFGVLQ